MPFGQSSGNYPVEKVEWVVYLKMCERDEPVRETPNNVGVGDGLAVAA
jgi:hypothetical protein